MAWSGGTFTRANPTWATDASLGIGIEAGRHDAQDNDFTTGINQCLNKDGSNSATGNLNFGGFLPTNVGAGTAAAPAYCAANDTNTGMYSSGADQISFATNGAERVRIGTSAAYTTIPFGINATPRAQLDVQTTEIAAQYATNYSNVINGYNFIFQKSRGTTIGTNTIVANGDTLGAIVFQGANGTNYTNAAVISAEVDNTPGATNDMPGRLVFATTADGSGSTTERMRITSGGFVFINTTTNFSADKLCLAFGASENGLGIRDNNDTSGTTFLVFRNSANGICGSVTRVTTTNAVNYNTSSDYRLKENVAPLQNGLQRTLALKPVKFDWIEGGEAAEGFIAHEVASVFAQAVSGVKDEVCADGQPKYQGVDYGKLTPLLAAAIQELNAKVEALEARVAVLEA